MLDLAPITEAYRTGRIEPHHVAAMLTEVDRLQSGGCARDQRTTQFCAEAVAKDAEIARLASELAAAPEAARRWAAIREAVATVHAATGLAGDAPLTDDTVAELLTNALQNASRAHFAETALRTDAEATARTIEHHRRLFVGQQARAERAELALAAAQAERDSLHTVAESRLMRMRTASQLLIAEIGAKGPENVDITAGRAVAVIEGLKEDAARRALVPVASQVVKLHQAWEGTTVCLHCGAPMPWEGMEACPGTQAGRVPVEWRHLPGSNGWDYADIGRFRLLTMGESKCAGWRLFFGDQHVVDRGPETGPAGKAAAEAAYLRACGFPGR